jgi:DNA-binding CsgD family transcriptional regulator
MALPLDRIVKLAADGMGSKLIARQLNADGIEVSYKTIQRLLKKVKA